MSEMITTSHGLMPREALEERRYTEEHDGGTVHALEYWLDGEMVHRSVEIALKGQEFKFEGGFTNG